MILLLHGQGLQHTCMCSQMLHEFRLYTPQGHWTRDRCNYGDKWTATTHSEVDVHPGYHSVCFICSFVSHFKVGWFVSTNSWMCTLSLMVWLYFFIQVYFLLQTVMENAWYHFIARDNENHLHCFIDSCLGIIATTSWTITSDSLSAQPVAFQHLI